MESALLAEKKHEELEQLRKMAALGFTSDDLITKTGNGKAAAAKYRDPENLANTWSGRGHRPQWLRDALDSGRQLDDFLIAS